MYDGNENYHFLKLIETMNINRILRFEKDDGLNRLREFLWRYWKQNAFKAMLAPIGLPDHTGVIPQLINDPDKLAEVNPFAPVMLNNTAAMFGNFLQVYPEGSLAIILRPCELRTLVELKKRSRNSSQFPISERLPDDPVIIIGTDCPGTYPARQYAQRVLLCGEEAVTREALQGDELIRGQSRLACQLCEWPAPEGADLTIGFLGAAASQYFIVAARNEIVDGRFQLEELTDQVATKEQVNRREAAIRAIALECASRRKKLINSKSWKVGDLCNLLAFSARCTLCADCLDACPLYNGELSGMLGISNQQKRRGPLLSEIVALSRWLAVCSGCGMCQEACEHGVSLIPLLFVISYRIRDELQYPAGDPLQQLPWESS